jgi:hypothetical protein
MRQGNILLPMKKPEEAFALSKRELATEHTTESEIMMARGFIKNGTNHIITGEVEQGLTLMKEDCGIFEIGDRYNHHQGLGWYLILQTDLAIAEIIQREPSEVVERTSLALEILTPIENWPGVERAWVSCAKAHESLENEDEAVKDLKELQHYVSKIKLQESAGLQ